DKGDGAVSLMPKEIAEEMLNIACAEDLGTPGRDFTSREKVGKLLKRLRFKKGPRESRGAVWQFCRGEVEALARGYGLDPDAAECQQAAPERPKAMNASTREEAARAASEEQE